MNVFGLSLCSCVHFSLPFRHINHINILICISSFYTLDKSIKKKIWKMLWFKKKGQPGHRTNFQKSIDQNQSFFLALIFLILFNMYMENKIKYYKICDIKYGIRFLFHEVFCLKLKFSV